jgi:aldose 1-epimerase
MDVYTDLPGIQIYTANATNVPNGKNDTSYGPGGGICFETQYYVNAINTDSPDFKKPILEANTPFHSETWYKFSLTGK